MGDPGAASRFGSQLADEVCKHRSTCGLENQEDFHVQNGEAATTIVPLIENLEDAKQVVRLHAATVLGSMGDDAEPAVAALIEMLKQDDVHDRRLAALTLGEIGPVAEEAISALLEAADDADDVVGEMAIWALGQIDSADDDAEAA